MSTNDILDTGYGITYGVNYGTGEQIPPIWTANLETARGDSTFLTEAVLSVNIECEHTGLWDASIDIAPVIDHEKFRFGRVGIRYQGDYWLGIEIETIQQAGDGTVTITGREIPGSALLTEEIEAHYERLRTVDAIRDFWADRTPFDATVHDPPDEMVYGIPVASARTPAAFDNILKSHPRDEGGNYLEAESGDAPNFEPTDPLQITTTGVELRQSNWVEHGEFNSGQEGGVDIVDDPNAVNGRTAKLTGTGASIEWTIETKYDIPEFVVVPRWRYAGGTKDSAVAVDVDNSTVKTAALVNVCESDYTWRYPPEFATQKTLSAGEHTITITNVTGDADIFVDLVSANDDRFAYEWDNTLDSEQQLSGPELLPDDYYMRLDPVEPGIDVTDIYIEAEYSTVTPRTNMSLFSTGAGVRRQPQTDETMDYHFDTPGEVPRIVPYPRLARTGTRTDKTPTTGFESQTLEALDISVDGHAVSVIHESGQTFSGSKLDVAQSLHEHAGYHFAIDHGNPSPDYLSVESFSRADTSLARDLPDEAIATSVSTSSGTGGYRNRVTVVGAEYPRAIRRDDDPRRFEATVEDEGEIMEFGLHNITIHDEELKTQGAVLARAREELRQRLNEDQKGGSLDTTPAIVEPGYPYRVPRILGHMDAVRAPPLADVPPGQLQYVTDGEVRAVRDVATIKGTLIIADGGKVVITSGGELRVPGTVGELRVSDTGTVDISESGELRTVENPSGAALGNVPAGTTRHVGSGESYTVPGTTTIDGTLKIDGTGSVLVNGGGGRVLVFGSGVIEAHSLRDEIITCSSWSISESASSATASGQFGRRGGLGGPDATGLLGLFTAASEAD